MSPDMRTTPAGRPAPLEDVFTGEANSPDGTTRPCVVACSPAACACPAVAAVADHTAAMLLTPPEVPTLDNMWAWGHRLRRGVAARVVTHRAANEAWRKAISRMGGSHGVDTRQ